MLTSYDHSCSQVTRGIATLVEWPYLGCCTKPSGRQVVVDGVALKSFQRIEQWAALESCYRRFRRTTQWMLSIDIDECVAQPLAACVPRASCVSHTCSILAGTSRPP